ncbi:MAG: UDP-N-acetylmuramate dehydrogenase [Litorilinea sp.]
MNALLNPTRTGTHTDTPTDTRIATHATLPPLPTGLDIEIRALVRLAPYTSIRVGGPAQWFATVNHPHQLLKLVRWARAIHLPYYILGGGSNILVADAGIRGLVIHNRCRQVRIDDAPCCDYPQDTRPYLFAESGAAMAGAARRSVRAGLTGLEWAVSVPGTVGGAVVGNAGAHGGELKDTLAYAQVLTAADTTRDEHTPSATDGEVCELTGADFNYTYRHSTLKQPGIVQAGFGPVVLGANFRLPLGDRAAIDARAESYLAHRRRTQPVEPSLGSTFMNPPGDYAGRLIEAAGLKGYQLGALVVSPQHANFIINPKGDTGPDSDTPAGAAGDSATAADVMRLIEHIRATVATAFGIELIPEEQRLGEWNA